MTPRVMQMSLRAEQPQLADPLVRKAILGMLDTNLLAAVGAGSDNTVTLAQALVRAPSDPGYVATAPKQLTADGAMELLEQAGYTKDTESSAPAPDTIPTRGRIVKDDQQLALVIGAASNDPTSVAVANTAADQLRNAGIDASVKALDPVALYGDALATNKVDAVMGWHAAGGDLATVLASRYGCPALEATPVSTTGVPPTTSSVPKPAPRTPATTPAPTPTPTTAVTTAPTSAPESGTLVQAPSNLTGICDRSIQPSIDGALDGSLEIDDVLTQVEPKLWELATVLPILQDTTIVAAGPSVQHVSLTGAIPVGIVSGAGTWAKVPQ